MKTAPSIRGMSLIEMIVYTAILSLVLALTYPLVFQMMNHSNDLHRNADDIVRVLAVGERWRADARSAIQTPRMFNDRCILILPEGKTITYSWHDECVWRSVDDVAAAVLKNVKHSRMGSQLRKHVIACCWDLELSGKTKRTRVRPLFSFQAVSGGDDDEPHS